MRLMEKKSYSRVKTIMSFEPTAYDIIAGVLRNLVPQCLSTGFVLVHLNRGAQSLRTRLSVTISARGDYTACENVYIGRA